MITLHEWRRTVKPVNELIVQASAPDGSDSWVPFPIGMCWGYTADVPQVGPHDKTVLCAISIATDGRRRPIGLNRRQIVATLETNGICNQSLSAQEYYSSLPSYKFVISPEGNGIDCHRHYEALIAGCIPIVEDHPGIREKYKGCPILFTKDYSEITPEYLEQVHEQMLHKQYNFTCLSINAYPRHLQNAIRQFGNIWMMRLTGKPWYVT